MEQTTLSQQSNAGSVNQESPSLYALLEQIEDKVCVRGKNLEDKEIALYVCPTIIALHKRINLKQGLNLRATYIDVYHNFNKTGKKEDKDVEELPYIDSLSAFQSEVITILHAKKINRSVNNVKAYICRTINNYYIDKLYKDPKTKVFANTSCVGDNTYKLENQRTDSYRVKLRQKSELYSERSDEQTETGSQLFPEEFDRFEEEISKLARLSPDQRQIFHYILHHESDQPKDIAEDLHKPVDKISRDKHRYQQRIQKVLKTPVGQKLWKEYGSPIK